ncbi:hypothetical protein [Pedobacter immunditicola]
MNAYFKSIAVLLASSLIALTACNNNKTIMSKHSQTAMNIARASFITVK